MGQIADEGTRDVATAWLMLTPEFEHVPTPVLCLVTNLPKHSDAQTWSLVSRNSMLIMCEGKWRSMRTLTSVDDKETTPAFCDES